MVKNKINNINKDLVKRKKFQSKEIKKIILKSIIQNLNVKPNIRALALKKNSKIKLNFFISKQTNNLCLKSGRFKGVLRETQICRHEMKKMALIGSLQNVKISAW